MEHKTYIKEEKGADTVVLFIHGFMGSTYHFKSFLPLVPENVSVYNVLLTGHGGTVRDFGRASMEKWKMQISEIVEGLEKTYRCIYIVAHSMGTFFAIEEAKSHSESVKGILLLQPPLKIRVKACAAVNAIRSFFDKFNNDAVAHEYKKAHSIKLNLCLWQYLSWIPRYVELFAESFRSRLSICGVCVPCSVVVSGRDEFVSEKAQKYIPRKDNIKLIVLPESSHFIYSEPEFEILKKAFLDMVCSGKSK